MFGTRFIILCSPDILWLVCNVWNVFLNWFYTAKFEITKAYFFLIFKPHSVQWTIKIKSLSFLSYQWTDTFDMEISSSNPLNIQLASFARTLEWKLKKQNEEKQSEYMKIKELCKTKEKPLTITNLYYSGQVAGSSCIECHPNITVSTVNGLYIIMIYRKHWQRYPYQKERGYFVSMRLTALLQILDPFN